MSVFGDCGGVAVQLGVIRDGNHADGAAIGVDEFLARFLAPARTHAEQGRNGEVLAVSAHRQPVGVPGGRDETLDFPGAGTQDRNGVDAAAGHVQPRAVAGDGQRRGCDAGHGLLKRLQGDGLRNAVLPCVDDGNGILVAVGDVQPIPRLIPEDGGRVEADRDRMGGEAGRQVDAGEGAGGSDSTLIHDHPVRGGRESGRGSEVIWSGHAPAPVGDVSHRAGRIQGRAEGRLLGPQRREGPVAGHINHRELIVGNQWNYGDALVLGVGRRG